VWEDRRREIKREGDRDGGKIEIERGWQLERQGVGRGGPGKGKGERGRFSSETTNFQLVRKSMIALYRTVLKTSIHSCTGN